MNDYPIGADEEAYYKRKVEDMQDDQREEWKATQALMAVPEKPSTIVRAAIGDVTEAITEYTRIQVALDKALPDCIQTIGGKDFRKKSYWRAIATAFNLSLEIRDEKLDEAESGAWGYLVTYRATAPNGRFADGDGSCFASEKSEAQATVHNVRAHAHTRAMNRAISNLVGFGEVSAEEVHYESTGRGAHLAHVAPSGAVSHGARVAPRPVDSPPRTPKATTGPMNPETRGPDCITHPQGTKLWAMWSAKWEEKNPSGSPEAKIENLKNLIGHFGYEHSRDIKKKEFDSVLVAIREWEVPDSAPADPAWEYEKKLPGEER